MVKNFLNRDGTGEHKTFYLGSPKDKNMPTKLPLPPNKLMFYAGMGLAVVVLLLRKSSTATGSWLLIVALALVLPKLSELFKAWMVGFGKRYN